MTQVNLKYRRPDGATTAGVLLTASDGVVQISSVRRYDTTGGEMTRVAYSSPLGSSVILDAGTWLFTLANVSDGRGGLLQGSDAQTFRVVPGSGGPYDVDDLDEVTVTDSLVLAPEWKTYIDAAITGVSAGATSPASITGSTAIGQALIVAASAAAARTTIGAAPTSHTHAVPTDLVATGTASAVTYLRGDGAWATPTVTGAAWADVTGKPTTFAPTAHTHDPADINTIAAITTFLASPDLATALAAIGAQAIGTAMTLAQLPAGAMVFCEGASTPRPTARTDIRVQWTASSAPTNAISGDVWLNGPDS